MLERLLLVALVVGLTVLTGRWWNARSGRLREASAELRADELAAVGLDPDGASTLALLLGSPTCAPCATVIRILRDLERQHAGFRWAYVDAADHLALVERHGIRRVPTLFVLTPEGRTLVRTSGVPDANALAEVLSAREPVRPAA